MTALPSIPRLYTALAECLAVGIYALPLGIRFGKTATIAASAAWALALSAFLQATGSVPLAWWIPCMAAAVGIQYLYLWVTRTISLLEAGYVCARAFVLAELAASAEWQLHCFLWPQRSGADGLSLALLAAAAMTVPTLAASHTVQRGDTMWKLAVQYQVGTSEIIDANPQVANPNLIYPGDVLDIPETDASVRACEQEVVRLVNAERAKHGLAALTEDWELSRVARYKSQDMHDNRYFAHNSPTYGTPFRMLRAFGLSYRTAGENIAMGYAAPAAVVAGWMNSEGHRANILSSAYTKIGVGYVADGHYWTQQFIG